MNTALRQVIGVGTLAAGLAGSALLPRSGAEARPIFDRCPPAWAARCYRPTPCLTKHTHVAGHHIIVGCHPKGHKA
jgi:hypothetical protein